MASLLEDDQPRRYSLHWQDNPPAIHVSIPQHFADSLEPLSAEVPIVQSLLHILNLNDNQFSGDITKRFGFAGSFQATYLADGQYVIRGVLPPAQKAFCNYCGGQEKVFGPTCPFCCGDGYRVKPDTDMVKALCASFSVLLLRLNFADTDSKATKKQLIRVEMTVSSRTYAIGGRFQVGLVKWLNNLPTRHPLPEVRQAVSSAYDRLASLSGYDERKCWAETGSMGGWVNISCPGDRCSINPRHGQVHREPAAYDFGCHNVDRPTQQLALLAGLAALHDQVAG